MYNKKTAGYGEISTEIKEVVTKRMVEGEWVEEEGKSVDDFKEAFSDFLRRR